MQRKAVDVLTHRIGFLYFLNAVSILAYLHIFYWSLLLSVIFAVQCAFRQILHSQRRSLWAKSI